MGIHSKTDLKRILTHFKLGHKNFDITTLDIGYINDTYSLSENGHPKYVLQRINHTVFENVERLMTNVHKALKSLKAETYSQIKIIPSVKGKSYLSDATGYWRVMSFISESTTYNTTTNFEIAFEAGRIVGLFHTLLAKEPLEHYRDTIPKFHNLELRKMQFLAALAKASTEKKEIAQEAISFAQEMLTKLEVNDISQLPKRICHNDTKLNNILFSKESNKALCLIDLDTLMPGYFLYDFGDAVRTIANTAAEDEQDHDKITFDKNLFEAFIMGLATNNSFLTNEELESLPYGAILMPFLHGIRALTDYLNNNIYYKVTYENQNLDRGLSLFHFTQKAMDHMEYMKKFIEEKIEAPS
jgi:Ser/Thr protein kinase RdoA (MazF antagonist)